MSSPVNDDLFRVLNNTIESAAMAGRGAGAVIGGGEAFAKRLRELLAESPYAGMKQTEQAEALGISKSLLNQWLSGRTRSPDAILVDNACLVLGANAPWLLESKGPKRRGEVAAVEDDAITQSSLGRREQKLIRMGRMDSDQELVALVQLWLDIPRTARKKYLRLIVAEAQKQGWIDEVPNAMLAGWSAAEKIAELKNKTNPPGTQ